MFWKETISCCIYTEAKKFLTKFEELQSELPEEEEADQTARSTGTSLLYYISLTMLSNFQGVDIKFCIFYENLA